MARLLKIQDLDQFSRVVRVPDAAISDEMIKNVRNLNERTELEPALREILYDPNETPHGPTEIADVLTSRVSVRGERRMAAFVLKGKSFPRVSSRHVSHQFLRLRQIPQLGVIVFLAVGDIQDDAQRDFVQTALDADCDYVIIDGHDCVRLLLAYEKLCAKDGTLFDAQGNCVIGHVRDEGIHLEVSIREELRYDISRLQDVSHSGAKRYSATLSIDRHYSRDVIREIVLDAVPKIRESTYHRSDLVESLWGTSQAHVVWLFLAGGPEDIRQANWLCRAQWIDPKLNRDLRPVRLGGDETLGDIDLAWNPLYESHGSFYRDKTGTKGQVVRALTSLLREAVHLNSEARIILSELEQGRIDEDEFSKRMIKLGPTIEGVYSRSGEIPLPPDDVKDFDTVAQSLFAVTHNLFLFFSEGASEQWDHDTRVSLTRSALNDFARQYTKAEFELERVHQG